MFAILFMVGKQGCDPDDCSGDKDILKFRADAGGFFEQSGKAHGDKAVPAQGKEIRRCGNVPVAKQGPELFGNDLFQFVAGGGVAGLGSKRCRIGQGTKELFAIYLAIHIDRQMIQHHKPFGDHVIGQIAAKDLHPDIAVILIGGDGRTKEGIGTDANRHHAGIADAVNLAQSFFNGGGFNPVSANFDLPVTTAAKFNHTI